MKLRAPYVATCFVGVVIGMALQSLLTSRRASAPQNTASAASFVVAQSWPGNPRVAATQSGPPARVILSGTNLPYVINSAPRQPNLPFIPTPPERDRTVLLESLTPAEMEKLDSALKSIAPKPTTTDNGFLFDGILPQDWQRINPREPTPPLVRPMPPQPR